MKPEYLSLSEEDTKRKFINPILESPTRGWKEYIQMEYPISLGRIQTTDNEPIRVNSKKADYVLKSKQGQIIAVIEAKAYKFHVGEGIAQAKEYAKKLDVPICYSTNGRTFYEIIFDGTKYSEREFELKDFPSQDELTEMFLKYRKDIKAENLEFINYKGRIENNGKKPRYYQKIAINKVLNAIANKQKRILLVMATGTGKTFVAKKIIEALNKNKPNSKILFLCDREALASQTCNEFSSFNNKIIRIGADKNNKYDKAAEIYVSLYHQLAPTSEKNPLLNYKPDFFDYIIIDECHRGSSNENSEWRKILDYFNTATHIGLTATPKESDDVSNAMYFGEPVYVYSLKEGIDDGYLATYTIFQIDMDDVENAAQTVGMKDDNGILILKAPTESEINRSYKYKERNKTVAREITKYLQSTDPYAKTIVFCKNDEHALDIKNELIKLNQEEMSKATSLGKSYIVRITANDDEGKAQLENFCSPYSKYPVIATTAELLTTGVDTQTVKFIVLDTQIKSDIKLKQIIGRGTRVRIYKEEDRQQFKDKTHFVIMDFGKSTDMLKNDDFFALPNVIYKGKPEQISEMLKTASAFRNIPRIKNVVTGEKVSVINKNILKLGEDFNLTSDKFVEIAQEKILKQFPTINDFNEAFLSLDIIEKSNFVPQILKDNEIKIDVLRDYKNIKDNIEDFDVLRIIAYNKIPTTLSSNVRIIKSSSVYNDLNDIQKEIVSLLLDKYQANGINDLISLQTLELEPLSNYGGMKKIINIIGGRDKYNELINNMLKLIL
ncbi:EcoAI/FtnUII family type I restriction enzme subunit R [Mycoplasmopsis verecunda]|uniref:Type I restriction enzyme, R subunit n=1 Tax=Mycoplasmopsis verecunda TaxID=171291 RepID=A0A1T4LRR9_9BACT|nr:type I restriction endonuclease subunit R [Mycoplasmopsis verecunda]WPB54588.1 DEAD/DEAH box helicase family protein [Mycoplasmopsis verecunda]SJZ57331.1 type I restriction enzyme, R subunit [Mycoplasmopsis verecunda]